MKKEPTSSETQFVFGIISVFSTVRLRFLIVFVDCETSDRLCLVRRIQLQLAATRLARYFSSALARFEHCFHAIYRDPRFGFQMKRTEPATPFRVIGHHQEASFSTSSSSPETMGTPAAQDQLAGATPGAAIVSASSSLQTRRTAGGRGSSQHVSGDDGTTLNQYNTQNVQHNTLNQQHVQQNLIDPAQLEQLVENTVQQRVDATR